MAEKRGVAARRVQFSLRLTDSTELSFKTELRLSPPPKRRRRSGRSAHYSWLVATACAALVLAMVAMVIGGLPGSGFGRPPWFDGGVTSGIVDAGRSGGDRPVMLARSAPRTVIRADTPSLRAHVAAPGETLFSIAARYGLTPQTVAVNNGLADAAAVRAGDSLLVPPLDAAVHIVREGESLTAIAERYGAPATAVASLNGIEYEPADVVPGRMLLLPVPDGRYPGFRLRVSDAPRVFAPRVRWPVDGVITQLFHWGHTGVDIAAPHGTPIVATDAGTVTSTGWSGPGGLHVCVRHDWGLETCAYHASAIVVEVGERVLVGQPIAAVGSTGVSSGAHVHWEARTNGVLVDPMSYAPFQSAATSVGGATGRP